MSEDSTAKDYSKNVIEKVLSRRYTIRFWHEFGELQLYQPYIDVFEKSEDDDEIVIDINSWGGDGETLYSFVHAIQHCSCRNIIAFVRVAYSAGAKLALACPKIKLAGAASMMLHAYNQAMPHIKQQELISRVSHFSENFDSYIDPLFEKILSPEEIKELHNGKDFWFCRPEIEQRLKKYGVGKIEFVD